VLRRAGGLVQIAAMVLFGLLIALVLAEAYLRTLGRPAGATRWLPLSYSVDAIDRLATGEAYVRFEPKLGWITTPRADRRPGTIRYRHNAAGLRSDREYSPTPPAGTRRLSAYGDSFTNCEEVDIDDCWTRRLERQLPGTEVLNFGVPAYAPDQAWLRYTQEGPSWQPCGVLIGHMVENINRIVNRFRPFYVQEEVGIPLAKPRFLLDGSGVRLLPSPAGSPAELKDPLWVETQLGPHDAWFFPGTFVANPLDTAQVVRVARTATFRRGRSEAEDWTPGWAERVYRAEGEAFRVLAGVLTEFAEQVRRDGATPVVLIFPTISDIESARDGRPKAHAPLSTLLEQRGIDVIDLTDALGEEARRTELRQVIRKHYAPGGNAVVSRTLASRLPPLLASTCRG
jgi:hypothetical protein